jgi:hypothetical protein
MEEFLEWTTLSELNTLYSSWSLNWLNWVPYFT